MAEVNINNNSDIGITCSCGVMFTGKATYAAELVKMFNEHEH